MYTGTRAKVVMTDGNNEELFLAGITHRDTLAPFLVPDSWNIHLGSAISGREQDFGFTLTPRKSSQHPTVHLDYADVICLLFDNVKQVLRTPEESVPWS